jgi:hypothetical protein
VRSPSGAGPLRRRRSPPSAARSPARVYTHHHNVPIRERKEENEFIFKIGHNILRAGINVRLSIKYLFENDDRLLVRLHLELHRLNRRMRHRQRELFGFDGCLLRGSILSAAEMKEYNKSE